MPRRTLRKRRGTGSRRMRGGQGGQPIDGANELYPLLVEKFTYGPLPGPFKLKKFADAAIKLKNEHGRLSSRDHRFKELVREFTPDLTQSVFIYMKRDPGIASNFFPPDGERGEYNLHYICKTILEDFLEMFIEHPSSIHKNNTKKNDKFFDILTKWGDTYRKQHESVQDRMIQELSKQ